MQSPLASIWSNHNYRTAALVTLLATAWLLSGVLLTGHQGDGGEEAGKATRARPEASLLVQARQIGAKSYVTRVLVNGRTEANRSVRLRAELDGGDRPSPGGGRE